LAIVALHSRDYEAALTAAQWGELCRFLKMDLSEVLKLTGPELLQATYRQIRKNGRRDLIQPIST